jgi:hypothetical protein
LIEILTFADCRTNRGVLTLKQQAIIGPVYGTHAVPAPTAMAAAASATPTATTNVVSPTSPGLARPISTTAAPSTPIATTAAAQTPAASAKPANPLLPSAQAAAAAAAANWKAVPTINSTKPRMLLIRHCLLCSSLFKLGLSSLTICCRSFNACCLTDVSLASPTNGSTGAAPSSVDVANAFYRVARLGAAFIKHGRRGAPHERTVVVSQLSTKSLKVDWGSGYMLLVRGDAKVVEGKVTEPFRRPSAAKAKDSDCFSIMTAARTLDLQVV